MRTANGQGTRIHRYFLWLLAVLINPRGILLPFRVSRSSGLSEFVNYKEYCISNQEISRSASNEENCCLAFCASSVNWSDVVTSGIASPNGRAVERRASRGNSERRRCAKEERGKVADGGIEISERRRIAKRTLFPATVFFFPPLSFRFSSLLFRRHSRE